MEKNHTSIAIDDFILDIAEDAVIESCPPPKEEEGEKEENREDSKVHITLNINNLPKVNKRALLKDSRTYKLEEFERNAMIIFNQENIDGYNKRIGTEKDASVLKSTFEEFRFDVDVHTDLYRLQVSEEMYNFSHRDFTNYGCIAIAILTHGSEKGGLRARDEKFKEKKILEFIKKNPTVVTKPIVYIIQACRGTRNAEVNVVYAKKDDSKNINLYKLPQNADTLVLHSTYEGKFTYRDEKNGSWFIQTLCEKINELADTEDLESIMTETKREIAIHKESLEVDDQTNKLEFNKQMPVTESTLIRKLYFKRRLLGIIRQPRTISNVLNENTEVHKCTETNEKDGGCEFCVKTALERFDYVVKSLDYYIKDNPKDGKARGLMVIAGNKEGVADDEIKIEVAKLIRNFFLENTCEKKYNDKYKYLYIWKDFEKE